MTAEIQAAASRSPGSGNSITRHPLIGVIAVLLGANISVLESKLLVIGLPDLRGVLGIGIDEASWLPTALNASQMFMGPMTIALGAIFGHRRVLLVSCVVYMLSSLLTPLVPDWHVMVAFQIIRGLSSGTFYPLTLSFVTQNLPRPWITFGLAAYAMDVLGSNHLAFPLYSFYHGHLSWHWIFWNSILFTSVTSVCVYFGMPVQKPLAEFHKMRYLDFLYASVGFTFLYVGLDQGERCDWFNSGLITGLFVAGILTLVFAVYSRFKTPNPLLDFRFLKGRNELLLAYLLTVYFVSLLGTFSLIPTYLRELQSYRPLEAASLATIGGIAAILVAPLMAVAVRVFDPRLLAAAGFALMSVGFFGEAHVLSTWLWQDFLPWQMIITIGNPIALVPLITLFLFSGSKPGVPTPPVRGYTTGAYFQTVRIFFSEAGGSVMQRFLLTRTHFWRTVLVSHVNGSWQTGERLAVLTGAMIPNATGLAVASERSLSLLVKSVLRQAETLAIADGFMVLGCFTVTALFVMALLRPVPVPGAVNR